MPLIDFQPLLQDDCVRLRPMRADDWPALYAVAADPLLWAAHPAPDRWQEPLFRAFFDAGLASGSALVVEDALTGAAIGSSRFDRERAGEGEVEIGWTFIARAHWGGGVNAAVKRLMIGHALTGYDRAIFLIGEDNVRSRRAIEKVGGVLTPRRVDAPVADRIVPHVVYAIDRPGFASGPLSRR